MLEAAVAEDIHGGANEPLKGGVRKAKAMVKINSEAEVEPRKNGMKMVQVMSHTSSLQHAATTSLLASKSTAPRASKAVLKDSAGIRDRKKDAEKAINKKEVLKAELRQRRATNLIGQAPQAPKSRVQLNVLLEALTDKKHDKEQFSAAFKGTSWDQQTIHSKRAIFSEARRNLREQGGLISHRVVGADVMEHLKSKVIADATCSSAKGSGAMATVTESSPDEQTAVHEMSETVEGSAEENEAKDHAVDGGAKTGGNF